MCFELDRQDYKGYREEKERFYQANWSQIRVPNDKRDPYHNNT